jgi:hypothetical protein
MRKVSSRQRVRLDPRHHGEGVAAAILLGRAGQAGAVHGGQRLQADQGARQNWVLTEEAHNDRNLASPFTSRNGFTRPGNPRWRWWRRVALLASTLRDATLISTEAQRLERWIDTLAE